MFVSKFLKRHSAELLVRYKQNKGISTRGEPHSRSKDVNITRSWEKWEYGSLDKYDNSLPKSTPDDIVHSQSLLQLTSCLSPEDTEKGIFSLEMYCSKDRVSKFCDILSRRTNLTRFLFEDPSNPNNVWAALRTLDSFGVQYADVVFSGMQHGDKQKLHTMSTALGTQKWISMRQYSDVKEAILNLKSGGCRVYATSSSPSSRSIYDVEWKHSSKSAIIIGNEDRGVSAEALALCDDIVHIPMSGFAESLNMSAAVAVLCGHLRSTGSLKPQLEHDESRLLLLSWLMRSVPGAGAILRRAGLSIVGNARYPTVCGFTTKP